MKRKINETASILLAAGLLAVLFSGIVAAEDKNYNDPIGEYKTIKAFSNGPCTAIYTGNCANLLVYNKWQCVEYVKRFYEDAMYYKGASEWSGEATHIMKRRWMEH